MTLLEVLVKAAGAPLSKLLEILGVAAAASPDLAPAADAIAERLKQPIDLEGLAKALPGELQDILKGHLNPREHPSDYA